MEIIQSSSTYKVDEKGREYREATHICDNGSKIVVIDYAITPELKAEREKRIASAIERFYKSVVRSGGHWISEEEMAAEA